MQQNRLLPHSASGFVTFGNVGEWPIYLFVDSLLIFTMLIVGCCHFIWSWINCLQCWDWYSRWRSTGLVKGNCAPQISFSRIWFLLPCFLVWLKSLLVVVWITHWLQISAEGIAKRDEKVFRFARARNIPIVMLTSGLFPYTNMSMKFIEYAPFLLCSTFLSCNI